MSATTSIDIDQSNDSSKSGTALNISAGTDGVGLSTESGAGIGISADGNVELSLPPVQMADVCACLPFGKLFSRGKAGRDGGQPNLDTDNLADGVGVAKPKLNTNANTTRNNMKLSSGGVGVGKPKLNANVGGIGIGVGGGNGGIGDGKPQLKVNFNTD